MKLVSLEIDEPASRRESIVDPHAVKTGGDLISSVLAIIKGMVGPAILYLPHGFATAGYIVALPIMALSTIMYLHSSKCLLDAWKFETHRMEQEQEVEPLQQHESSFPSRDAHESQRTSPTSPQLSYPELAFRAYGKRGEALVKIGIAAMQSGVCLTYFIFVPHNLTSSVQSMAGVNISPNVWLVVMVLIQIPLCWIRDISHFTITNSIANLMILYGLVTCLGFAIQEAVQGASAVAMVNVATHWHSLAALEPGWFLFIGTSVRTKCRNMNTGSRHSLIRFCPPIQQVLLFEGSITLLVPLQESVQQPLDRAHFPKVYKRVVLSIVCFFAVFGITCWMAFGNDVKTVLTTSLPEGFMATTVQLAYSIAVIFTFPLQFWPCLDISTRSIQMTLTTKCRASILFHYNVLSSILVCLLALVAVTTMNSLDKVVSLMGSLLGCPIAFVFPPLIHIQLDPNLPSRRIQCNYIVAGLGLLSMVVASIATIIQWGA